MVLLTDLKIKESQNGMVDLIAGFNNNRFQRVSIRKGDNPKLVAAALMALAENIINDDELKNS